MHLNRLIYLLIGAGLTIAACSVSDTKKVDDDGNGGAGGASSSAGSTGTGMTGMCEDTCIPQFPGGEADYRALRGCLLCGACADACAKENGGICDAPADAGCSAMSADCATCTASACALEQLPDTNFAGVCAAQGAVCSMNVDCVSLNNCVAECTMGGSTTTTTTGGGGGAGGTMGN